jgi:hypothetical protein
MAKWTDIKWDDALLKIAEKGLVEAGIIIEGQAVALCPVDTGRLRGSITYATSKFRTMVSMPAKPGDEVSEPGDDYTLYVGTNVEYAPYMEYGTCRRNMETGQPFLRPAMDIKRDEVCRKYAETISEELHRRAQ